MHSSGPTASTASILTYAMEGIVFDKEGNFFDWVWPVIEACDIGGVNSYPMNDAGWFTFGAFDESRRFLRNRDFRREQFTKYEERFRVLREQLAKARKPLILTEAGFPSAVRYHREAERLIIPESDHSHYAEAMYEFVSMLRRINDEYDHPIRGIYFYEWRDNLYHHKVWNVEGSPIHITFGLCDRDGDLCEGRSQAAGRLRTHHRLLKKAGYRGYVALEYEGEEDAKTAVRRNLQSLRRLIS